MPSRDDYKRGQYLRCSISRIFFVLLIPPRIYFFSRTPRNTQNVDIPLILVFFRCFSLSRSVLSVMVSVFCLDLSRLPSWQQLLMLSTGVFVAFLVYGYLQELIFSLEGFRPFGWFLTFIQVRFWWVRLMDHIWKRRSGVSNGQWYPFSSCIDLKTQRGRWTDTQMDEWKLLAERY